MNNENDDWKDLVYFKLLKDRLTTEIIYETLYFDKDGKLTNEQSATDKYQNEIGRKMIQDVQDYETIFNREFKNRSNPAIKITSFIESEIELVTTWVTQLKINTPQSMREIVDLGRSYLEFLKGKLKTINLQKIPVKLPSQYDMTVELKTQTAIALCCFYINVHPNEFLGYYNRKLVERYYAIFPRSERVGLNDDKNSNNIKAKRFLNVEEWLIKNNMMTEEFKDDRFSFKDNYIKKYGNDPFETRRK